MNIVAKSLVVTAMLMSGSVFAHPEVPGQAVISKATELGVHRIERLVTLNRIDPTFLSNLQVLKVERVNENGAVFKITALTEPGANNQASSLIMLSDNQGKVLSHTPGPVIAPANPVAWPIKDAGTLFEDALHFVLEGWVQNPPAKAFYLGLMTISLEALNENGQLVAHFVVTSDDDARTLHIKLATDGTVLSHEIK
jgi:hypothetical protein